MDKKAWGVQREMLAEGSAQWDYTWEMRNGPKLVSRKFGLCGKQHQANPSLLLWVHNLMPRGLKGVRFTFKFTFMAQKAHHLLGLASSLWHYWIIILLMLRVGGMDPKGNPFSSFSWFLNTTQHVPLPVIFFSFSTWSLSAFASV